MARIDTGNALATAMLQPGAKFINDGFGLITGTLVFKEDDAGSSAFLARGQPCPIAAFSFTKVHKASTTLDALNLTTYTVDYVGVSLSTNGGVRTDPNLSSANGLTTENITTHPNFFTQDASFTGGPIAGVVYAQSELGPLVEIKSPVDYIAQVVSGRTLIVTKTQSWIGNNGACFEGEDGGRFIGFVDPTYPNFFGKSNYLTRTTSYSGVLYTTLLAEVQALLLLLNSATATNSWGASFVLLPAWAPIGVGSGGGNVNLLSQVNVEEFASLYKIMFEIRYSKVGWHPSVYTNI